MAWLIGYTLVGGLSRTFSKVMAQPGGGTVCQSGSNSYQGRTFHSEICANSPSTNRGSGHSHIHSGSGVRYLASRLKYYRTGTPSETSCYPAGGYKLKAKDIVESTNGANQLIARDSLLAGGSFATLCEACGPPSPLSLKLWEYLSHEARVKAKGHSTFVTYRSVNGLGHIGCHDTECWTEGGSSSSCASTCSNNNQRCCPTPTPCAGPGC